MSSPQQHDDPFGEARGQLLQALAVLTTVGEAAARHAVAGAQNRAARSERQARAAQLGATGNHRADLLDAAARAESAKTARHLISKAFDEQWLNKATIFDAAGLWRTAAMHASTGDQRAREAMRLAEGRLRQLNPILMGAYTRHRGAGMNLAEAMRAAAHDMWQHETRVHGRPHGNAGDPKPGLRPAPKAIGVDSNPRGRAAVDELDAAVRAEVARLADGVDPELLDQVQRQWRSAGHAPAADAASLLAATARHLRAQAQLGGPTTGAATVRRGVNHPSSHRRPPAEIAHDTADVAVRTALAGYQLAADGLDRAAAQALTRQAEAAHLTGLADQNQRAAAIDAGSPDLPATTADEHRDGLASATVRRGVAEYQQAAADQQRRLGRAFPPLTNVYPTLSAGPGPGGQNTPTQRKGQTR